MRRRKRSEKGAHAQASYRQKLGDHEHSPLFLAHRDAEDHANVGMVKLGHDGHLLRERLDSFLLVLGVSNELHGDLTAVKDSPVHHAETAAAKNGCFVGHLNFGIVQLPAFSKVGLRSVCEASGVRGAALLASDGSFRWDGAHLVACGGVGRRSSRRAS